MANKFVVGPMRASIEIRHIIRQWLKARGGRSGIEGYHLRHDNKHFGVMFTTNRAHVWDHVNGELVGTVCFGDPDLFVKLDRLLK